MSAVKVFCICCARSRRLYKGIFLKDHQDGMRTENDVGSFCTLFIEQLISKLLDTVL